MPKMISGKNASYFLEKNIQLKQTQEHLVKNKAQNDTGSDPVDFK